MNIEVFDVTEDITYNRTKSLIQCRKSAFFPSAKSPTSVKPASPNTKIVIIVFAVLMIILIGVAVSCCCCCFFVWSR